MSEIKKDLFLFTSYYPYGGHETFIDNELKYLSGAFRKIYIIPLNRPAGVRPIPGNCEVLQSDYSDDGYSIWSVLLRNPLELLSYYRMELQSNGDKIESKKECFSSCLRGFFKAGKLEDLLKDYNMDNAIIYSYWMDNWATLLSILKTGGKIPNLFTRAHGYDLYADRRATNYIPFRSFQMTQCDVISIISQQGVDYLKSEYPQYANKITLDYLGTNDYGFNEEEADEIVHMVSVSNVYPVKRVALIVELLHQIKIPVKWTHFGDGGLMDELKRKIAELPARHTVELLGRKENQEVMRFLKSTKITYLINVSSSEGLPVSIMEAASFGIPIVATDVGGTNEIVNDDTGMLIEENFDVKDVANRIQNDCIEKFKRTEFKVGVRAYWKARFSADTNYVRFIERLVNYEF
ncbi:MAG: glycosyltransferase [Flavobacteriales bacterium]|nr:glycosyltransferase [Flavobacteriales bacterium]